MCVCMCVRVCVCVCVLVSVVYFSLTILFLHKHTLILDCEGILLTTWKSRCVHVDLYLLYYCIVCVHNTHKIPNCINTHSFQTTVVDTPCLGSVINNLTQLRVYYYGNQSESIPRSKRLEHGCDRYNPTGSSRWFQQ